MKNYSAFGLYKTVRAHLLAQQVQCGDDDNCFYRMTPPDENGVELQCAIGCLIDDDHYEPWMDELQEASSVYGIGKLVANNTPLGFNAAEHLELCKALQAVHDTIDEEFWPALNYIQHWELVRAYENQTVTIIDGSQSVGVRALIMNTMRKHHPEVFAL